MSDKIKTLSQAIRLGATFRPQCTNGAYIYQGTSCAIGAAFEATTGRELYGPLPKSWMERFAVNRDLLETIVRRNDSGESRESIADWLEAQGL